MPFVTCPFPLNLGTNQNPLYYGTLHHHDEREGTILWPKQIGNTPELKLLVVDKLLFCPQVIIFKACSPQNLFHEQGEIGTSEETCATPIELE